MVAVLGDVTADVDVTVKLGVTDEVFEKLGVMLGVIVDVLEKLGVTVCVELNVGVIVAVFE